MKYIVLFSIVIFSLINFCCFSATPFESKNYAVGLEISTPPGGVIISYSHGSKYEKANLVESGSLYELSYLGVSNKTVAIQYREYTSINYNWLIRDAYTQNLSYDLSVSDVIVFRNLKIKIKEASPILLRFIVLNDPFQSDVDNGIKIYPSTPNSWEE